MVSDGVSDETENVHPIIWYSKILNQSIRVVGDTKTYSRVSGPC